MAKSAAERKAAQRERQSAAGNRKLELVLDEQEMEMLARNCAERRPGRVLSLMFGFSSIICVANVALSIGNWWKPC